MREAGSRPRRWPAARSGIAAGLLFASACGLSCKREPEILPVRFSTATIKVNGKSITVEVANTSERRDRGLMYRDSLPPGQGMLFVYEMEETLSFWMKNTRITLDIAFIKSDGWISQITSMEPASLKSHKSDMRAMFALEMNKGWFEANGVKVGGTVEIPEEVAKSGG